MSRFPSGRVLPPLNEIGRISTGGLADAYLADIKSSNLAEKVTFSSANGECGENLGPEKHEIRDGKRRHHQTKAPNQHLADGRTELRSARLFCRLDDLAVFLFSHLCPRCRFFHHASPSREGNVQCWGYSEAIRRLEVAIQPQSYSLIQRMASASHFDSDT